MNDILSLPNLVAGTELCRFAFILGVIVSLVLYDRFHRGTGSVIIPGYLGILVFRPHLVLLTIVTALATHWLIYGILSRQQMFQPRTRFALSLATSVCLHALLRQLVMLPGLEVAAGWGLEETGYLIPGLIAHEMSRQGRCRTLVNLLLATLLVGVAVVAFVFIFPPLATTQPAFFAPHQLFADQWLPVMLVLAVSMALLIQRQTRLRCGGFVSAAYLAMQANNPAGLFVLLVLAAATFAIVKYALMPGSIVFGRRKFAGMLLIGALVSWTTIFILDITTCGGASDLGFPGYSMMSIVLCGLIANDIERAGIDKVAFGILINVAFVIATTLFLTSVVEIGDPSVLLASAGVSLLIITGVLHRPIQELIRVFAGFLIDDRPPAIRTRVAESDSIGCG